MSITLAFRRIPKTLRKETKKKKRKRGRENWTAIRKEEIIKKFCCSCGEVVVTVQAIPSILHN